MRAMTSGLPRWGVWLSLAITLIVLLPIALLLTEVLAPRIEMWERMLNTFLPQVIGNTIFLALGVGIGSVVIGTVFAWLVTAYEFPGRRILEHLLLLPLAVPGYIIGFVYVSIFEFAGPIQTTLRDLTGGDVRAWFPQITSPGGVVFVLTLVLYPYVYILARAAFREQSARTFDAARIMGFSRTQTFLRLLLPMARPQIAAGMVLVMMEAITDYGTVSFFGFPTLAERVVVLWNVEFDSGPATELASLLLFFALGIILLERVLRGRAKYYQQGIGGQAPPRVVLHGWQRWTALGATLLLLAFAFIIPLVQLIIWTIREIQNPSIGLWHATYGEYIGNSLLLSISAAIVVLLLAVLIAYGVRASAIRGRTGLPRALTRLVTLGYAMPGAVIAVGVLMVVNPIDGPITDFAENVLGRTDPGYLLTGTITALVYAYVVRFMAVGYNSVESSMEKITPNIEYAARTLGARSWRVLTRIHAPLIRTGIAAGAILVFVDVMKELPAAMLLRPFGMNTLALWTYFLSMESFWQAAAIPALTLLVVGLLPVALLIQLGERRDGTDSYRV